MSRSSWKPLYNKVDLTINKKKKINKLYNRNFTILPKDIGLNIKIYNGIRFFDIEIKENMVYHKIGEFSPSRVKPIHKKKKK